MCTTSRCLARVAAVVSTALLASGCTPDRAVAPAPADLAVAAAPNLVGNPGFESGAVVWQKITAGGRSVVTTTAHSGSRSAQIIVSSSYARAIYQDVPVHGGGSYDAAGWVRTSGIGGAGARIEIVWLDASGLGETPPAGSILGTATVGTVTGTTAWTSVATSLVAPDAALVARVQLKLFADADNSGTAWFDDLSLVSDTPDLTPPSVTITAPADGATLGGTVVVQATATDDVGVTQAQLRVDGANAGAPDVAAPYAFTLNTVTLANGAHTISVVASDASGKTGTATIAVTVSNSASARPNFVIILSDDERWDHMQYMPLTSQLLSAETVRFGNAIATTPLCCPSRASLLTGQYIHNHGVLQNSGTNGSRFKLKDGSTLATWLQGAGYRTAMIGKYFNDYGFYSPYIPPGWSDWHAVVEHDEKYYNYHLNHNGVVQAYGSAPQDYSTDVFTALATDFIRTTPAAQPLFLYLTPQGPHDPAIPAPPDGGKFAAFPNWRPPSYNEADVSDKPRLVRSLPKMSSTQIVASDALHRKMLETLQSIDRMVLSVADALKQSGRWGNTVFVYASDNGIAWGEHRIRDLKNCPYEECIRVPIWVRAPGLAARTDTNLVAIMDIAPTFAAMAGVTPANRVNGESLAGLLANPVTPWRSSILIEQMGFSSSYLNYQGVRTSRYLYVEYKNGEREFYDMRVDPFQLTNRVTDPSYSTTITQLRNELAALRLE